MEDHGPQLVPLCVQVRGTNGELIFLSDALITAMEENYPSVPQIAYVSLVSTSNF